METTLLLQKLKTLQTLLGKEQLIITGSMALAYHGLIEFTEVNDLDLLVLNPTSTGLEILTKLQEANPSPKFIEGGVVNYQFFYEGIKIDVWTISRSEDGAKYMVTDEGIRIASIKSIVKAKKSFNRSKDWVQLMQLASKIFDESEFKSVLPTLNHYTDYSEVVIEQSKPKAKI